MKAEPILRGELGLIGLLDLGELLMLNRASGCLAIQDAGRKAFLYFEDGRLVSAVDDELLEGESAAYRIFAWRSGRFEFRPEPPTVGASIHSTTDAVMLEAARLMNESPPSVSRTGTSEASKLTERQAALDELRDAFQRAIGAAAQHRDPGAPPTDLIARLVEPRDRLVLRPGHPPRLRRGRQWSRPGGPALSPTAYQDLRARLFQQCAPPEANQPAAKATRRLYRPDGKAIALEVVGSGPHEALWLRPVELPPRDPSRLGGDTEALRAVLRRAPGLVLVGGADLEQSRELLQAILSCVVQDQDATLLLASDDMTFRHGDQVGVVLRVPADELRATLRTIEPDIVGLDPAIGPGQVALEDLEPVPRVVAGVVGPDAASLLPRWLARLARRASQRARACLATTPIGLVMADQAPEPDAVISFTVHPLTEPERELALRGRTAGLSAALDRTRPRKPRLRVSR